MFDHGIKIVELLYLFVAYHDEVVNAVIASVVVALEVVLLEFL
jgi:hypothetical protein